MKSYSSGTVMFYIINIMNLKHLWLCWNYTKLC